MTREEAVALLERYSNYEGLGIPNLAGCKEAMKVAAEALKEAYPELAESEDERIRRWLCDYFSSIDKAWIHKDIICIDILRWLEKQKEQKPEVKLVFPKFRVGDIIRNVRDKWDKKTRRISYVGEHGYNFDYRHVGDKVSGGSFGFCFEDDYELVEQKPAEWSEEDEEILKLLILNIGRYMYFGGMSSERILSFLKSLRPSWKPSEDEECKNSK